MNELEQIRRLWLQLRGDYQQELIKNWSDKSQAEAQRLASLHQIVQQALDTFQPQG